MHIFQHTNTHQSSTIKPTLLQSLPVDPKPISHALDTGNVAQPYVGAPPQGPR